MFIRMNIEHHNLQNHPDNIQDTDMIEGREALLVNEEPELEGEGEQFEQGADVKLNGAQL